LRFGNYEEVLVASSQFAFTREIGNDMILVIVNSAYESTELNLPIRGKSSWCFVDLLNPEEKFTGDPSENLQINMRPNQVRLLRNG
jgi:hypothetical protein